MKKKSVLSIALSVVGLATIGCGGYFVYRGFKPKSDGTITIKVIELNNVLIKQKTIDYSAGSTLVSLVSNNFDNVVLKDGMLMSIESLSTPSDWSTYICIYINDQVSNYGINDIKFNNGDTISFVNSVFSWNE